MKKILLPALLSGFAIFCWVNISWMLLPWHKTTIHELQNQIEIQDLLARSISIDKPAVYALPAMHQKIEHDGPSAMIALTPHPTGFSPMKLLYEFLMDVFLSGIVTILLLNAKLPNYSQRFQFVLLMGLGLAFGRFIPDMIWWGYASDYVLVGIADTFCMSVVAAAVLAKLAK